MFKSKDERIINQGFKTGKVKIGNNCWIGSNVVILKGVTIGDNVVIGAGCVITESVENNKIVRNQINMKVEDRR